MPPKVDISTLVAKRDNALSALYELFEEFKLVAEIESETKVELLRNIYGQIEPKYRDIRKQIEHITNKAIECGISSDDPALVSNNQIATKSKADYFFVTHQYLDYKKKYADQNQHANPSATTESLKDMNCSLRKMVETLSLKNNDKGHGLEKLSVPTWDGKRRTYKTWQREFNHWMNKYKQDKDEQLQRFRKALPKGGAYNYLCENAKQARSIVKAWQILDQEFANERKLMDDLLKELVKQKQIRSDSKSLAFYASKIEAFANDMEDNGYSIDSSSEAPFIMSQILSKLDPKDNVCFGREMMREKKEENLVNLVDWLREESFIRSRGKEEEKGAKVDSHAIEKQEDETCPLCDKKHFIYSCKVYNDLTVDEKWKVVRKFSLCRKCLRSHHTSECPKKDGSTCSECTRNHHRTLHSTNQSGKGKSAPGNQFPRQSPSNQTSTGNQTSSRQSPSNQASRQAPSNQASCQPPSNQVSRQAPSNQASCQPPSNQASRQASSNQSTHQPSSNQASHQPPSNQTSRQQPNYQVPTTKAHDGTTKNWFPYRPANSQYAPWSYRPQYPSLSRQLKTPTDFEMFTPRPYTGFNSVQKRTTSATSICPVQKVLVNDADGKPVEVIALMDSGSNTSLLSKATAARLGLSGKKSQLTMNLAGGEKRCESTEEIDIQLGSVTDNSLQKHLSLYTVQKPCSSAKTISKKFIESFEHLKDISDDLYLGGGAVDILIGVDLPDAFVDFQVRQGSTNDPIAKQNCFGWYALGTFNKNDEGHINSIDIDTVNTLDDIRKLVTQDMMGVQRTNLCTCSDDALKENKFIKSIAESTKIVDGRVQIKMPWNDTGPPRKSNFKMALKRMLSSEKTFHKKNCFQDIEAEVQKLIEQEFVVEIPEEEVNHDQQEWYLPMHAVFTPERSTKIRLVFDSSAKGCDGLSLNDHLEKGPNYLNDLTTVIITWRWDQVAFTGDIRKMFNQVTVHPDDQVFHRFLFRKSSSSKPTIYQWKRLNFGDKPAPDIATGCIITLAKSAQEEFPQASRQLLKNIYMDDIGGSEKDSEEAKHLTDEIDSILNKGKFQIKAWHYNAQTLDKTEEDTVDFLGHKWYKSKDTFSFKRQEIELPRPNTLTKRSCLSMLSKMWDPIGLTSPVSIKFRINLQELWSSGYSWDEVLPDHVTQEWIRNAEIINKLLSFTFERKLKPENAVGYPELHGFSDGSELAYGAVLILRWLLSNNEYLCIPLLAKAFVAPLKKKSIPRLELMGCLALSRIYNSCKSALEFMEIQEWEKYIWLDSTTVLSWIKTSPKKFKPFVSARVAEIQENTDPDNYHFGYIPSNDNPADALTRGIQPEALQHWMKGPEFLYQSDLPSQEKETDHEFSCEETIELRKADEVPAETDVFSSCSQKQDDSALLNRILARSSTLNKARRVMAYILRFVWNVRSNKRKCGPLSSEELHDSERRLFMMCQTDIQMPRVDKNLDARVDEDGLLRAHGRLENIRSLPKEMRNPIILPGKHKLVHLLLKHLHKAKGHCGYQSLIHEARRTYWIIGLRSLAKQLTKECITCRKLRQRPLQQLMGQLPEIRTGVGLPPFAYTALDMFGPIHIKISRKTLKEAQIIIFTCMTTRAIHLELCTDKSADTFLMAFTRFVNLRGHPVICWSDCGTNFKGAQSDLQETLKDWDIEEVRTRISDQHSCEFKWIWNIPHASHMNGVVESLIKSVRQALNGTCLNRPFTEEQWRTFLTLYPSSNDIWEAPPITPNDLLIGPSHIRPPTRELEDRISPRELCKSLQKRAEEFWLCWKRYFAPTLLERNKWFRERKNLREGDLILELDTSPRRKWKMALVKEVYPGRDGLGS